MAWELKNATCPDCSACSSVSIATSTAPASAYTLSKELSKTEEAGSNISAKETKAVFLRCFFRDFGIEIGVLRLADNYRSDRNPSMLRNAPFGAGIAHSKTEKRN